MRPVRLWSGLVLVAYVVCHLANHALALVSIDAAEAGRRVHGKIWAGDVGFSLLSLALGAHFVVALVGLLQRGTLRMPAWQWLQHGLGFAIPTFLFAHVALTKIAHLQHGVTASYVVMTRFYFDVDPVGGALMVVFVVVAWTHGCVGLHYWLRIRAWYARARAALMVGAVLLPTFALLGIWSTWREILAVKDDPARWAALAHGWVFHPADAPAFANEVGTSAFLSVVASLLVVGVVRGVRAFAARRAGAFTVTYDSGQRVPALPGTTILEASRKAGVPHAAVCGGRGRCSTCRVRVGSSSTCLVAPSADELRVLERVGAPPNVRLACQARPVADVLVSPLVPSTLQADRALHPPPMEGQEKEIAILFADLRGFTKLSERKLPFDLVYILNRYCAAMGEAVAEAGGQVDKFIGDGVMALFGVDDGPDEGCRRAVAAARSMAQRMVDLNAVLAHDLKEPLRIGIGIHVGHAIVGEIGWGTARSMTAIGDAVNTASRLESATKDLGVQLLLSADVARRAGVDGAAHTRHEIEVRGRDEKLLVVAVANARDLAQTPR